MIPYSSLWAEGAGQGHKRRSWVALNSFPSDWSSHREELYLSPPSIPGGGTEGADQGPFQAGVLLRKYSAKCSWHNNSALVVDVFCFISSVRLLQCYIIAAWRGYSATKVGQKSQNICGMKRYRISAGSYGLHIHWKRSTITAPQTFAGANKALWLLRPSMHFSRSLARWISFISFSNSATGLVDRGNAVNVAYPMRRCSPIFSLGQMW